MLTGAKRQETNAKGKRQKAIGKRQETMPKDKGKRQKAIILAKCPNTVWVLHCEKVVLGVALSCYVVLGSRVVLCCVARSELR